MEEMTWILMAIMAGILAWMGFNYFRLRRAAKVVENAEFASLIRQGQLVDLREPVDFHSKTYLGGSKHPINAVKRKFGSTSVKISQSCSMKMLAVNE